MRTLSCIFLCILASYAFSEAPRAASASSSTPITVLYTDKNVTVKDKNGTQRTLSRGSALNVGDTIITAGKGAANIKYSNGTLVNLGENTSYTIDNYSPSSKDIQLKTKLNTGKVRFKTTGKTKEQITTPVVALAILGTDATVFVSAAKTTYVNVTQGVVKAQGTVLKNGESALINKGGAVSYAPFPKEGNVTPPTNSQGNISGGSTPSSGAGPVNDLETIALITTLTTGTTASSGITSTALADISIIGCP